MTCCLQVSNLTLQADWLAYDFKISCRPPACRFSAYRRPTSTREGNFDKDFRKQQHVFTHAAVFCEVETKQNFLICTAVLESKLHSLQPGITPPPTENWKQRCCYSWNHTSQSLWGFSFIHVMMYWSWIQGALSVWGERIQSTFVLSRWDTHSYANRHLIERKQSSETRRDASLLVIPQAPS